MPGGVLDLKWSGRLHAPGALVGAVCSTGLLSIHSIADADALLQPLVTASAEVSAGGSPPLLLSLDWADRLGRDDSRLVTTSSLGEVAVWRLEGGALRVEANWQAHDLECWVAAFSADSADVIFSGADDCVLRAWDLRVGTDAPVASSRRVHSMGVTTMQASSHRPFVLATGSYDEHVRLWDTRNLARPFAQGRTPGGGVWRIKHHPSRDNEWLVGAMHSGAFILTPDAADPSLLSTAQHYTGHTSLAYGADWHPSGNGVVATCSFYDHSLHLWHVDY